MSSQLTATFHASAMSTPTADQIRARMRDDYGNDLTAKVDDGTGPCRHCLQYAKPGDRLILFSYRPFEKPALYQEVGPVFIHADGCERYAGSEMIPPAFAARPLILRPYTSEHAIADSQVFAPAGRAPEMAAALFENPDVAYLHVRSVSRGCYLFRIERFSAL
ncbi:MAG TPA: DUF1203 domain-containing protein [Candidatus Tumulicola sp.]|nr:DUF1203 domain-containing protein [Candidatus Tumulicola sp.]